MNKNHLHQFLEVAVQETKALPKVTKKEDFISYSFEVINEYTVKAERERHATLKAYIDKNGWTITDEEAHKLFGGYRFVGKRFLTILYNYKKDKISVAYFDVGLGYAYNKHRIYPHRKNSPALCLSKHLYEFFQFRKDPLKVRIVKGGVHRDSIISKMIIEILNTSVESMEVGVAHRHMRDIKDPITVLQNAYGVKIPKILVEILTLQDLMSMVKVIKPEDYNRLCQAWYEYRAVATKDNPEFVFHKGTGVDLCTLLIQIFKLEDKTWLIRDYIEDHKSLKKMMSLKITSVKRIEDEHQKMSKERMIQGIKEIKVAKPYKDILTDLPFECELIQDKKRLLQESLDQDHCVATYGQQINSGSCAIFSLTYNEKRFTLQVQYREVNQEKRYEVVQLQGFRNRESVPAELSLMLRESLDKISDSIPLIVPSVVPVW